MCERNSIGKGKPTISGPIKTLGVNWNDIEKIGLPTDGYDYPDRKRKKSYSVLMQFLTEIKKKMDELETKLKKSDILLLNIVEQQLQLKPGEGYKFLGADEIKHRVKNIIKRTDFIDMNKIIEKKLENHNERKTETIS